MLDPEFLIFGDKKMYIIYNDIVEDEVENGFHLRTGILDAGGSMNAVTTATIVILLN